MGGVFSGKMAKLKSKWKKTETYGGQFRPKKKKKNLGKF
jgi:hypothetical protein